MGRLTAVALLVVTVLLSAVPTAKADIADWKIERSTRRVRWGDPALRAGVSSTVNLAKNESEGLQILVKADSTGALLCITTVESPTNSAGKQLPLHVYRAGPIEAAASNWEGHDDIYLDPLIPYNENGTFLRRDSNDHLVAAAPDLPDFNRHAFPYQLQANEVSSIWFEVYAPEDAASGDYTGKIGFTDCANLLQPEVTVPITAHVREMSIPSTSSIAAFVGLNAANLCRAHLKRDCYASEWSSAFAPLVRMYARFFLEHRISMQLSDFRVEPEGPNESWDTSAVDRWADYYASVITGTERWSGPLKGSTDDCGRVPLVLGKKLQRGEPFLALGLVGSHEGDWSRH